MAPLCRSLGLFSAPKGDRGEELSISNVNAVKSYTCFPLLSHLVSVAGPQTLEGLNDSVTLTSSQLQWALISCSSSPTTHYLVSDAAEMPTSGWFLCT